MRIITRRLVSVPLHRPETVESTYVPGTSEIVYEFSHNIDADIQAAENKLNFELYGARVSDMKNLYCPVGTDVAERDRLVIGGVNYDVVSSVAYMTHVAVVAEKAVQDE